MPRGDGQAHDPFWEEAIRSGRKRKTSTLRTCTVQRGMGSRMREVIISRYAASRTAIILSTVIKRSIALNVQIHRLYDRL
jgi:hypothetical protein